MKEVIVSMMGKKAGGVILGLLLFTTYGLSSFVHAMPLTGITGDERLTIVPQPAMGSVGESVRLVGTRDHNEDPIPDSATQEMNNPKKKMDKSMKQGSSAKSRAGQGPDGHTDAKHKKSIKPDQQDNESDRPDDRRQGGNVDPKP